jgi:hypothetical protein
MHTVLDSAHTWFFESLAQNLGGALTIRLVEGIKGADRLPVEIEGTTLGPYFPVTVEPRSRCAVIHFSKALELFTYEESFDTTDPELVGEEGRSIVRRIQSSSFRSFASSRTNVASLHAGALHEFLIWTEDQVFQVLSASEPEIAITDAAPDLTVERGRTWSAS